MTERYRTLVATRSVRWLGVLGIAVLVAAALHLLERLLGFRTAMFAFNMHFILMAGADLTDRVLAPQLTARRFEVSSREVQIYRRLGVIAFMRLLRSIGWEAAIRNRKIFDGTRRTLPAYERATRHSENSHGWLFLIALAPAAWAITRGWWDSVFWITSMNVVFHAYPIMLQRTQRARLAAILRRLASKPVSAGAALS